MEFPSILTHMFSKTLLKEFPKELKNPKNLRNKLHYFGNVKEIVEKNINLITEGTHKIIFNEILHGITEKSSNQISERSAK